LSGTVRRVHRLAAAEPARGERARARARGPRSGRAGRADLLQRQRAAARRRALLPALRGVAAAALPRAAAPGARRRLRRLRGRVEVEVRDLVDVRLALRDQRRDAAAGLLTAVRSPAR